MSAEFRFFADHLAAPNDRNGNPVRAYLIRHLCTGDVCAVYGEDYGGWNSVPEPIRRRCIAPRVRFNMPAREVRKWVREFDTPPVAAILAESDQLADANPWG